MDMGDEAWENIIRPELDAYYGKIFETLCLQYVMEQVRIGRLRPVYQAYGKWWGTDPSSRTEEDIDVVAATREEILVGECKWCEEMTGSRLYCRIVIRRSVIRLIECVSVNIAGTDFEISYN